MRVVTLAEIQASLPVADAILAIEEGFMAYSRGEVHSPPVQQFIFEENEGDCCIKSAWTAQSDYFAVKVSSGFYQNPRRGLASNHGLILLLSATTGQPVALLNDEGWLTAVRTAVAGRIAARLLMPARVHAIGIYGTGLQAQLQLRQLLEITDCRDVLVWGRSTQSLAAMREAMRDADIHFVATTRAEQVAREANLIVTATPSRAPLINDDWVSPGTHITAVGADGPGKQELALTLPGKAALIAVDSRKQCSQYGEVSGAIAAGLIGQERLTELGTLLAGPAWVRGQDDITLADLTGLGIQDLQIARSLMRALP